MQRDANLRIGQFLAVGWSDGYVRLMGLENNKAAHHIRVCEDASAKITHIGWSRNTVGEPDALGKQSQLKPAAWESAVSEELGGLLLGKRPVLDLPRELTFLEVDSSLPKISPLPAGSAGEGCVGSRRVASRHAAASLHDDRLTRFSVL